MTEISATRSADPHAPTAAAAFDLSSRAKVELRGPDRAGFLQGFCTNDVRLPPGRGCEAFLTSGQARILARLLVYVLPDALWLDADPGLAGKIISHLGHYLIAEQVELRNWTEELGLVRLAGPRAGQVLEQLAGNQAVLIRGLTQPPGSASLACAQAELAGVPCQVRRQAELGLPGFDLLPPAEETGQLLAALARAGAAQAGTDAYQALRIEAGTPAYPADVDESNLPQELDRDDRAISFTKGCYLGQETVARIHALGHVNRLLVRLSLSGPAAAGERLLEGGREVGKITSAALSSGRGWIALGYVRRERAAAGTVLAAEAGARAAVLERSRSCSEGLSGNRDLIRTPAPPG